MTEIEPFGLDANSWQFLASPDAYVEASRGTARQLDPVSTRRQFATARAILERLNGSRREAARRGILLADDAGLGKTTVAALVAWVVVGNEDASVRVLAPNAVMRRRWSEELQSHVRLLKSCAPLLGARLKAVRADAGRRLRSGSIHVATHHEAMQERALKCDLLIVDEAHRAKGSATGFSKALRKQSGDAGRVLILTATPLSIDPSELERMLALVGGYEAKHPIRQYSRAINTFYQRAPSTSAEQTVAKLVERAKSAVDALRPFVIRHCVHDLPEEQASIGTIDHTWSFEIRPVGPEELELLLRMDRVLRVVNDERARADNRTNDPRYHTGWMQLRKDAKDLRAWLDDGQRRTDAIARAQLGPIGELTGKLTTHPKVQAVAREVQATVASGEKVLLFCHHHATARELTHGLLEHILESKSQGRASEETWCSAWHSILSASPAEEDVPGRYGDLRDTFCNWLSTRSIRIQVETWIDSSLDLRKSAVLKRALQATPARGHGVSIAKAARALFARLIESGSNSTLAVLRAAKTNLNYLPGADGVRVLAVCEAPEEPSERVGFIGSQQPDTAIAIFNSPFGPDVLVATDKLSEGIDLHRYCRHLIHYELDASPIRTIQRNGRLLRVRSWASVTQQPVRIAYPVFKGTRNEKLVRVMSRRIGAFSRLLGRVPDVNLDTDEGDDKWRAEVLVSLGKELRPLNGELTIPHAESRRAATLRDKQRRLASRQSLEKSGATPTNIP